MLPLYAATDLSAATGHQYVKSPFYSVLQKDKWDLVTEKNPQIHGHQRQLVSQAYSMEDVKSLEPLVDDIICQFVKRLNGLTGEVVNIGHWFQLFTIGKCVGAKGNGQPLAYPWSLDALAEITFSQSFGCIDRGSDDGILGMTQRFFNCAAWIGYAPWLAKIHNIFAPLTDTWLDINLRSTHFGNLTAQKTRRRLGRVGVKGDMVGLLQKVQEQYPQEFSESNMFSMLRSNMVAGTYTISTTLAMATWYLLKHPEILRRFQAALNELRRELPQPHPIPLARAQKMALLEPIIYETLRCHSPFAQQLPRVVPKSGLLIESKYFLPAGVMFPTTQQATERTG
jgi:cytochrome P450